MKRMKTILLSLALSTFVLATPGTPQGASPSPILEAMRSELDRSMKDLRIEGRERPYFISYLVQDSSTVTIKASLGTLVQSDESDTRNLKVDLRVGDYELDNSNLESSVWESGDSYKYRHLPCENDTDALKHQLWLATDYFYKKALEDYSKKVKQTLLVSGEESQADFSIQQPADYIGSVVALDLDKPGWEERIKALSAIFSEYPDILISSVALEARALNSYFVSSEGSRIQEGNTGYIIVVSAFTRSKDGMPISTEQRFASVDGLFDTKTIEQGIEEMLDGVTGLRNAHDCESYAGPVLIKSPASPVYVAAELAPLLTAQKSSPNSSEGIENKAGQRILLPSINIYDDPTIATYKGHPLAGFYRYDDQGVAGQRVNLVTQGILKNVLLSRSPVKGFEKSNGHFRSDRVCAGNLILESSAPQSEQSLENALIAECRKLGKPYGLIISTARLDEGGGGNADNTLIINGMVFNLAGAGESSSSFKPLEVYRLYTDGRKELERGVEALPASPLITFTRIIAAGSEPGVLTREGGNSSVVAPSILLSEMEVRKSKAGMQPLPILPAPQAD